MSWVQEWGRLKISEQILIVNAIGNVQIRVSVNVTKPLKKIIVLKQEGEEDIPMSMVYEQLSNFYFCCECIGHQFRECKDYSGYQKEELPFETWLKAISLANRTKLNKKKE